MSETGHVEERLGPYMDGELDAMERQRVAAHLERCRSCRQALQQWQALQARMRSSEVPDPGPAYWERFAERVEARLAAAPHPGREASSRVGWIRRGLRGLWPTQRFAWGRLAGAVAVLALVTYVGVRSFAPQLKSIRAPMRVPLPQSSVPAESLGSVSAATLSPEAAKKKKELGSAELEKGVTTPRVPSEVPVTPSRSLQERALQGLHAVSNGAAGGVSPEAGQVPEGGSQAMEVQQSTPSVVSDKEQAPATVPQPVGRGAEAKNRSAFELEMHHPREEALEETRCFVVAALASEVPTARALREDLQRIAPADTMRLRAMDTWLQAEASTASPEPPAPSARLMRDRVPSAAPKPQPEPLLALDALVWPQRYEEAWRDLLTELAQRLVDAAPHSEALQERAVAYARFLAQESRDEASRAAWRQQLERIRP